MEYLSGRRRAWSGNSLMSSTGTTLGSQFLEDSRNRDLGFVVKEKSKQNLGAPDVIPPHSTPSPGKTSTWAEQVMSSEESDPSPRMTSVEAGRHRSHIPSHDEAIETLYLKDDDQALDTIHEQQHGGEDRSGMEETSRSTSRTPASREETRTSSGLSLNRSRSNIGTPLVGLASAQEGRRSAPVREGNRSASIQDDGKSAPVRESNRSGSIQDGNRSAPRTPQSRSSANGRSTPALTDSGIHADLGSSWPATRLRQVSSSHSRPRSLEKRLPGDIRSASREASAEKEAAEDSIADSAEVPEPEDEEGPEPQRPVPKTLAAVSPQKRKGGGRLGPGLRGEGRGRGVRKPVTTTAPIRQPKNVKRDDERSPFPRRLNNPRNASPPQRSTRAPRSSESDADRKRTTKKRVIKTFSARPKWTQSRKASPEPDRPKTPTFYVSKENPYRPGAKSRVSSPTRSRSLSRVGQPEKLKKQRSRSHSPQTQKKAPSLKVKVKRTKSYQKPAPKPAFPTEPVLHPLGMPL
ncbi:unnamed protein product [Cyprideis torosa]|uniref:Uncharacterized protein n=1 Tax=Cyprideis torosa TaxID=163714 RepID=A0A7R8WEZ4_9CRUS|nr:unnamed protein product [Cyprideis torosa]CAG0891301.1 unnamed protein product [Cyprideis torosa]